MTSNLRPLYGLSVRIGVALAASFGSGVGAAPLPPHCGASCPASMATHVSQTIDPCFKACGGLKGTKNLDSDCLKACRSGGKSGSGKSSPKSSSGGTPFKESQILKDADPCTRKFVPGSSSWKKCKGIDAPERKVDLFLTPAQCAKKYKKGSRQYLACIN